MVIGMPLFLQITFGIILVPIVLYLLFYALYFLFMIVMSPFALFLKICDVLEKKIKTAQGLTK